MNIDERDSVAAQFGVSTEQVERDHLISYVLAFLGSSIRDQVQFIGGTAPARTHLPAGRLSEDIDLIAGVSRAAAFIFVRRVLAHPQRFRSRWVLRNLLTLDT